MVLSSLAACYLPDKMEYPAFAVFMFSSSLHHVLAVIADITPKL